MDINSSLNNLFGGEPEPTSHDRIADALEILVRHKTDGRLIKENAQEIQEQQEQLEKSVVVSSLKKSLDSKDSYKNRMFSKKLSTKNSLLQSSGAEYTMERNLSHLLISTLML